MFDSHQLDNKKSLEKAIETCWVWGYNSAEAFDFTSTRCQSTNFKGDCNSTMVTKEFQCIN